MSGGGASHGGGGSHASSGSHGPNLSFGAWAAIAVAAIGAVVGLYFLVAGPAEYLLDFGTVGVDNERMATQGFLASEVVDVPEGGWSLSVRMPQSIHIEGSRMITFTSEDGEVNLQRPGQLETELVRGAWYRLDESLRQFRLGARPVEEIGVRERKRTFRPMRVYLEVRPIDPEVATTLPQASPQQESPR